MGEQFVIISYILVFAIAIFGKLGRGNRLNLVDRIANSILNTIIAFFGAKKVKQFFLLIGGLAAFYFLYLIAQIFGYHFYFELFCGLLILLLVFFVFYVGIYPAYAANFIARTFVKIGASDTIKGFWSLFDANRKKREVALMALVSLVVFTVFAEFYLFAHFFEKHKSFFSTWQPLVLALVFLSILVIIFLIDYNKLKQKPRTVQYGKTKEVRRLLENVCISAGLRQPGLEIIATNNYLAYSDYTDGQYTIFLSVGILNKFEDNEISAIFAHEISKINAGSIRDFKYIIILLHFYKAISSGFVVLLFGVFSPVFFSVWLLLLLIFSLERIQKNSPFDINENSPFYLLSILLLPNLALMNFLSCLVYYLLSYQEVFLADLQAILLTRYPKGLHGALTRTKDEKKNAVYYGARIDRLYFSGEGIFSDIPLPQPAISLRLAVIEKLESSLHGLKVEPKKTNINCLLCHQPTEAIKADSHYLKKNIEIDRCKNCLSVWFDSDELLYIADLRTLCDKDRLNKTKISYSSFDKFLMCPHCGIVLKKMRATVMPQDISIFYCPGCEGNFLLHDDIYKYGLLRKKGK